MQIKSVTLPFLRIEAQGGRAYLIVGRTIVRETAVPLYAPLEELAIRIAKELIPLRIDCSRVTIEVKIPTNETPIVLWPK